MFESEQDCLVFIKHPVKAKNRGYEMKYEEFAKVSKDSGVKVMRMRAYNES